MSWKFLMWFVCSAIFHEHDHASIHIQTNLFLVFLPYYLPNSVSSPAHRGSSTLHAHDGHRRKESSHQHDVPASKFHIQSL